MRKAMLVGAQFASSMNDSNRANKYKSVIATLETQIMAHWNGSFLIESTGRTMDGAVIHAFNVAFRETGESDDFLTVIDEKVAATVQQYNTMFCKEYPINVSDNDNKVPGIL